MLKKFKKEIHFTLVLVLIGQLLFAAVAKDYTKEQYENRIFTTVGIEFADDNLHKLNEAAHYFGQTMIGWTKFPNFMANLQEDVELPEGATINAHMQERQNLIFTVYTTTPLEVSDLEETSDYIQEQMDVYNDEAGTRFKLTNLDYEIANTTRSYVDGALITLILSLVLAFGLVFIRHEFKR